jgi:hypothetical protein
LRSGALHLLGTLALRGGTHRGRVDVDHARLVRIVLLLGRRGGGSRRRA